MTTEPLDAPTRDALHDAVETYAASGDFDATWRAAQAHAQPRSRAMAWAVAAAALLTLSLPLWSMVGERDSAGTIIATGDWVEPVPLRFDLPPPVPAAADLVRQASTSTDARAQRRLWDAAMAATPPADRPELASRRALLEQVNGDLDAARQAGLVGTGPGQLVAAEVHLVDLNREKGVAVLRRLATDPQVGDTAQAYLDLLEGPAVAGDLAEVAALSHTGGLEAAACGAAAMLLDLASDDTKTQVFALAPSLASCP